MSQPSNQQDRYRFQWSLLYPRYWLTWLGLFAFFVVTLLPVFIIDWLGERIGHIAARQNRKRFNIAKTNLTLCFPEKTLCEIDEMVCAHFRAQFRSLVHYSILWWRPKAIVKKLIQTTDFERITQLQDNGKNVIILLPHFVGLEFAVAAIAMEYVSVGPYKPMRNPVIDWVVAKGRRRFGNIESNRLFTREDGLRPLIRETRKGKVLVYLVDEDLGADNSLFVPFFSISKATVPVLGRLAKSCNAVVMPCVSCYDKFQRHYSISLLPPIQGLPSGDDHADSLRMNDALEQAIRYCPSQYFWTLRYFQTRPPGEESVYD